MPKQRKLAKTLTNVSLIALGAALYAGGSHYLPASFPHETFASIKQSVLGGMKRSEARSAQVASSQQAVPAKSDTAKKPAVAGADKSPVSSIKVPAAAAPSPQAPTPITGAAAGLAPEPAATVIPRESTSAPVKKAEVPPSSQPPAKPAAPSAEKLINRAALSPKQEIRSEQPVAASVAAPLVPPAVPASKAEAPHAPDNALGAIASAVQKPGDDPIAKKPSLEQSLIAAYAPLPELQAEADRKSGKAPVMPVDTTGMRDALAAYRAGDLAKGDAAAKTAKNDIARTALEWSALRLQSRTAGFDRIEAFLSKHPDWPMADWLRARAEQAMYADHVGAQKLTLWFDKNQPVSPAGKMLVARRLIAAGKKEEAHQLVSDMWRHEKLSTWAEGAVLKEFAPLLTAADHRFKSDRLFYSDKYPASLAIAAKAGKEYLDFANARVAVARGGDPAKAGAKINAKLKKDPTWHFAQITRLRKAKKFEEAAKLLVAAPADPESIVDATEWWEERRIVARKRLDDGAPEQAYQIVANHGALSGEPFIAAEFHAGWFALRFLKKPEEALGHFARALEAASTPISRSRAAYWAGRAAELGPEPEDAERLYAIAAQHSSTYYGQLAMQRLGRTDVPIRTTEYIAQGDTRRMAIRVVEVLEALDQKDLALPLAVGMGRTLNDRSQLAALAAVLTQAKDARATLIVGKLSGHRGIEIDDIAFPTFGIPEFAPLENSAARPIVYAIARQESAFQAKVVSHAGAKGLMQMLTSTAQRTAKNKKVPFDANRLLNDPAFNAQLGAAHLGELMQEHPGSLIMVFAAYNAGGHRVKQWVQAYGDPRKPGVDPIDWVERIPFTETRNYVQRVAENLGIYRTRMKELAVPHVAQKDLRAYAARM